MLLAVAMLLSAAGGRWLDVPYVRQEKNGCGAASIAMVMQYWIAKGAPAAASDADPQGIQKLLYSRRAEGIFASDMEGYFREKGFDTFAFRGEWADLVNHIGKGRPLIVCLKQGAPLHYVVVAGGDADFVLLNDPARRKLLKLDRAAFERDWKDRWTLLALPRQTARPAAGSQPEGPPHSRLHRRIPNLWRPAWPCGPPSSSGVGSFERQAG